MAVPHDDWTANRTSSVTTSNISTSTGPIVVIWIDRSNYHADETAIRKGIEAAQRAVQQFADHSAEMLDDLFSEKTEQEYFSEREPVPVTPPTDTREPPGLNQQHGPRLALQGWPPTWQRPPPSLLP